MSMVKNGVFFGIFFSYGEKDKELVYKMDIERRIRGVFSR